mmetsp:Transcript_41535/g.130053  ORF Transcript_41535/g.130053 Transcript_41535/m.130053 type:complete len:475 (+) Transcript_41535:301-1725(+)
MSRNGTVCESWTFRRPFTHEACTGVEACYTDDFNDREGTCGCFADFGYADDGSGGCARTWSYYVVLCFTFVAWACCCGFVALNARAMLRYFNEFKGRRRKRRTIQVVANATAILGFSASALWQGAMSLLFYGVAGERFAGVVRDSMHTLVCSSFVACQCAVAMLPLLFSSDIIGSDRAIALAKVTSRGIDGRPAGAAPDTVAGADKPPLRFSLYRPVGGSPQLWLLVSTPAAAPFLLAVFPPSIVSTFLNAYTSCITWPVAFCESRRAVAILEGSPDPRVSEHAVLIKALNASIKRLGAILALLAPVLIISGSGVVNRDSDNAVVAIAVICTTVCTANAFIHAVVKYATQVLGILALHIRGVAPAPLVLLPRSRSEVLNGILEERDAGEGHWPPGGGFAFESDRGARSMSRGASGSGGGARWGSWTANGDDEFFAGDSIACPATSVPRGNAKETLSGVWASANHQRMQPKPADQ